MRNSKHLTASSASSCLFLLLPARILCSTIQQEPFSHKIISSLQFLNKHHISLEPSIFIKKNNSNIMIWICDKVATHWKTVALHGKRTLGMQHDGTFKQSAASDKKIKRVHLDQWRCLFRWFYCIHLFSGTVALTSIPGMAPSFSHPGRALCHSLGRLQTRLHQFWLLPWHCQDLLNSVRYNGRQAPITSCINMPTWSFA